MTDEQPDELEIMDMEMEKEEDISVTAQPVQETNEDEKHGDLIPYRSRKDNSAEGRAMFSNKYTDDEFDKSITEEHIYEVVDRDDPPKFISTKGLIIANLSPPYSSMLLKKLVESIVNTFDPTQRVIRLWLNKSRSHCFVLCTDVKCATEIRNKLYGTYLEDHCTDEDREKGLVGTGGHKLFVEFVPVKGLLSWIDMESKGPKDAIWQVKFTEEKNKKAQSTAKSAATTTESPSTTGSEESTEAKSETENETKSETEAKPETVPNDSETFKVASNRMLNYRNRASLSYGSHESKPTTGPRGPSSRGGFRSRGYYHQGPPPRSLYNPQYDYQRGGRYNSYNSGRYPYPPQPYGVEPYPYPSNYDQGRGGRYYNERGPRPMRGGRPPRPEATRTSRTQRSQPDRRVDDRDLKGYGRTDISSRSRSRSPVRREDTLSPEWAT